MSKFTAIELWNERFGTLEEVADYSGRLMKKSACGNPDSSYHPTLDHIRPISQGGKDTKDNLEICHRNTNAEKGDSFPHWKANGQRFKAVRMKNSKTGYVIKKDE